MCRPVAPAAAAAAAVEQAAWVLLATWRRPALVQQVCEGGEGMRGVGAAPGA